MLIKQGFPDRPAFGTRSPRRSCPGSRRASSAPTLPPPPPRPRARLREAGPRRRAVPGRRRRRARSRFRARRAARRRTRRCVPRGHARVRLGEPGGASGARDSHDRFELIAEVVAAALRRLGVVTPGSARCRASTAPAPGASTPAAGRSSPGSGSGSSPAAAHVGGVLVVNDSRLLRETLDPVYAALGLEWDSGDRRRDRGRGPGDDARRRRAGPHRRARQRFDARARGDRSGDPRPGRRPRGGARAPDIIWSW